MKRIPLVAGNWKMHGSIAQVDTFVHGLKPAALPAEVETLICPPYPYLAHFAQAAAATDLRIGGQNLCGQSGTGAHTGEVSGAMLVDCRCSHVIVGHSERRAMHGEDDALVAAKFGVALNVGLSPILCVGETQAEREAGETEQVLARQLDAVLAEYGVAGLERAVIGYEPVWAIGTGRTATPAQAQDVHAFIRARLAAVDATISATIRIIYGGSVKPDNAAELFACEDVDGGLVGGASLEAESFLALCRVASLKN